jgi:hypothetical protein
MVCKLERQNGSRICDAKNIYDALNFVVDTGLVRSYDLSAWKKYSFEKLTSDQYNRLHGPTLRKLYNTNAFYDQYIDISRPSQYNCNEIFMIRENFKFSPAQKINDYVESKNLKKTLLSGPAIASIRLTWEFQAFTGSLFNPNEKQTFCRQSKPSDRNNYCDPARSGAWDEAQKAEQGNADQDTWYNHFVTLHGWGVKTTSEGDVPYWVVENSWGRIYENDASPQVVNNGAGKEYWIGQPDTIKYKVLNHYRKNQFVLVADRVAGKGGLEMTSRAVFYAILPNLQNGVFMQK